MVYLGLDYGRRKIGLALSEGKLASPLTTWSVASDDDLLLRLKGLVEADKVDTIIIGLPAGPLERAVKHIAERIKRVLSIRVILWDETLTTKNAARLLIESGASQKRRHTREDAVAAGLILQSYLDTARAS
ncbi:MAG: Holliday junction resolvase RuvX [bacterium]|nr:Holliday junction resolvase RuvX [bacterium]